jgi:hypothetical protein
VIGGADDEERDLGHPLANKQFRILWSATALSFLGNGLRLAAVTWWLASSGKSGTQVGFVMLCVGAFTVLALPFAGSTADRADRRVILIAASLLRGAIVCVIGIEVLRGTAGIAAITAGLCCVAAGDAFFETAGDSLVPNIVGKTRIAEAVGLYQLVENLAPAVGPILSGLLYGRLGLGGLLLVNGVALLACAGLIARTDRGLAVRAVSIHEQASGFRALFADRTLARIICMWFALNAFGWPLLIVLPMLIGRVFGGGAPAAGLAQSLVFAGAVAGAIAVNIKPRIVSGVAGFTAALTLAGGLIALTPLYTRLEEIFLVAPVLGAGFGIASIYLVSKLQTHVSDAARGRSLALAGVATGLATPIGYGLSGIAIDAVGIVPLESFCGLAIVTLGWIAYGLLREAGGKRT